MRCSPDFITRKANQTIPPLSLVMVVVRAIELPMQNGSVVRNLIRLAHSLGLRDQNPSLLGLADAAMAAVARN